MQKSNLPQGLRTLQKWYATKALRFNLPIQRAAGQWSPLQKSLLVHSLLADFPVPPLYFIKYKEGDRVIYQALDGKQRCTSLFEYINGHYKLHSSTPDVVIDGKTIELAGKEFNDLSDEVKDLIRGYRFTIYLLEDATDDEIEEAFARLNNSSPLTLIQKARTEMGSELATWTREITCAPFFQNAVPMTLAQARRESELEILLQSMLLIDARHQNYNYKAISMREVTNYCKEIRGNYPTEKRERISKIVNFLTDAFPQQMKFLKKTNAVMVFLMADLALEHKITPKDFNAFIQYFSENVPLEYEENTGAGNIKRTKTEGRLKAMQNSMENHFKLKDTKAPKTSSKPLLKEEKQQ
nr:DUF262 domain-containing protein [uncultured Faecalimonas sp.]